MSFSKRMGLIPEKVILLEDVTQEIRVSVWNAFYTEFYRRAGNPNMQIGIFPVLYNFCKKLWMEVFIESVHEINLDGYVIGEKIRSYLLKCPWSELYNFIEFVTDFLNNEAHEFLEGFVKVCNAALQREGSGYRIVNNTVIQITNEIELKEIELALSGKYSDNVNIHLSAALEKMSDKFRPIIEIQSKNLFQPLKVCVDK